ncbi:DUF4145 domain-containing protein [Rhizobium anhuiense]|uniref:DUF4145 domain-containing protein n=1 Tax=Rhizobium anhuiense TaxID=1184720 RepID=A0A432N8D6_9HYPH|nr:DUF4145 domain-containing protein [Rhizobium anhuiense]RUL95830.1 DUF4145 domain-containing protein [Rhizobium anhuiense]UTS90989.1 DUF4145 domain-containing protein [Rhizobium anhuiense bv. trifolii]GGE12249.1 hypothetical protein GCM10008012_63640 [Rhizobium anhuiense]
MPTQKLSARFADLIVQARTVEATKTHHRSEYSGEYDSVDKNQLIGWKVKAKNLLASACAKDSEHYQAFVEAEKPESYRDSWQELQQLKSILMAAQEDYNGGYLDKVRSLVQAELFSDELDQARQLLAASYATPAAVVAGVVLETKLRDMCIAQGLSTGKLDKMNADLAKAGEYSLLVQKRVTAIADVRNSAAHGHPEKFTADDVREMIEYVERFLLDHS